MYVALKCYHLHDDNDFGVVVFPLDKERLDFLAFLAERMSGLFGFIEAAKEMGERYYRRSSLGELWERVQGDRPVTLDRPPACRSARVLMRAVRVYDDGGVLFVADDVDQGDMVFSAAVSLEELRNILDKPLDARE